MKNTLIVNAEQMIMNYREAMMDFLNDTQDDLTVTEFGNDLMRLGKTLQELCSKVPGVSLSAFRQELGAGYTMMMLESNQFDQLEAWSKAGEDFQLGIFWENGNPVGLLRKEQVVW